MKGRPHQHVPRLIAWEVTRSCVLACKHCRAAAQPTPYEGELSTEEGCRLRLPDGSIRPLPTFPRDEITRLFD